MPNVLSTETRPTLADKIINGHDPSADQAHWLVEDTASGKDTKAELDTIADETFDYVQTYTRWRDWHTLEAGDGSGETSGTFDFSAIERDLSYAEERGIPYIVRVPTRSFSGTAAVMPGDLVAQYEIDTPGGGRTAILTEQVPRVRYQKCLIAIMDRFGNRRGFAGIGVSESAGQPSDNASARRDQWNLLYNGVAAVHPSCIKTIGWNFYSGITGGSTDAEIASGMDQILAGLPTDGTIVLWTPDIILPTTYLRNGTSQWDSLVHRVYSCFRSDFYKGGIVCAVNDHRVASSFQYDSYRWGEDASDTYFNNGGSISGDADADGGENDLNGDGYIDKYEMARWAMHRLFPPGKGIIMWSRVNFPGIGGTPFQYTYDRTTGGSPFGSTYGDGEAVTRFGWFTGATHPGNYRDGP